MFRLLVPNLFWRAIENASPIVTTRIKGFSRLLVSLYLLSIRCPVALFRRRCTRTLVSSRTSELSAITKSTRAVLRSVHRSHPLAICL